MKEKRDETIILRLSKTEKNRIYEKMLSMQRIGIFSSFTTLVFSQVSSRTALPLVLSAMTSAIMFQVPTSFQSPL